MHGYKVILDFRYEAIEALGINLSQLLALIGPLDQCIGFQLPWSHCFRSPWTQSSEAIILAVQVTWCSLLGHIPSQKS